MNLNDALAIESPKEKTATLRKLFAPYTAAIEIDGQEAQTLVVLINLVYKRSEIEDLTNLSTAKAVLRDPLLLDKCISEVKWFHTHNLKYPDIRVSHQRLLSEVVSEDIDGVCSKSLPKQVGWSHNSSAVNHAKLFLTSFYWQGQLTNLAALLVAENVRWINLIREYGFTKKAVLQIASKIKQALPVQELPTQVSNYSPQLQMPYMQGYLAVTPVVSHTMLCKIQQLTLERKLNSGIVKHSKPANVGDLTSSLGGNVQVMRYFPKTSPKSNNRSNTVSTEVGSLFNTQALLTGQLQQAILVLVGIKQFNTLRQRRLAKLVAIKQVRLSLQLWLEKLLEFINNTEKQAYPAGGKEFLEQDITNRISKLSNVLNESLASSNKFKRFAYHPSLISLFKKQLGYVLTHSMCEEEDLIDKQVVYVHCQNMRIFDAEGMPNSYIQGMPSLTALHGVAHKFERKLKSFIDPAIRVLGSAIFIADYNLHSGKPIPEQNQTKQVNGRNTVKRPSIMDKPKCDITIDLVFRLYMPNLEVLAKLTSQTIKSVFPTVFAGGVMHSPSLYENSKWCGLYTEPNQLFERLKLITSHGSWLYPSKRVVKSFEQLIEALDSDFNLRPFGIGFAALEEPVQRSAAVHDLHCYAEPVIGLLECVSPTSLKYAGAKRFFHDAFWIMDVQKTSMLMKKSQFEYD